MHCRKYYLHDCRRDSHVHKSITNIIAIEPQNLKKCNRRCHLQLAIAIESASCIVPTEVATCRIMQKILCIYFIATYRHWNSARHWNTGLLSSGNSLTSWGEGVSLALAGNLSSNGVTIKMPYGVDILHRPASHPIFSYWVG